MMTITPGVSLGTNLADTCKERVAVGAVQHHGRCRAAQSKAGGERRSNAHAERMPGAADLSVLGHTGAKSSLKQRFRR